MPADNPRSIEFIGLVLATAIAVVVSEGCYDVTDSFVGVTLFTLVFRYSRVSGTRRESPFVLSTVVGLCLLLLGGVVIDNNVLSNAACTENTIGYVLLWLGGTGGAYLYLKKEH